MCEWGPNTKFQEKSVNSHWVNAPIRSIFVVSRSSAVLVDI